MKTQLKNTLAFRKTLTQVAVATALLSTTQSSMAYANEGAQDTDLEQIVVTASRSQQDKFLSLSSTQVIGQLEIEQIQPQNITELLNTVAGVSVASLGGAGQTSSVYTRGTNSNHTLILVDGVRVGSATLGTTNFAAMSVGLIDRIEVVKGPRGALWGSDAIGGVIQIFTKKLSSNEGVVTAGMGSHGYWKMSGAAGFGNEQHSLTVAASAEKSNGFNATDYPGQEDDDGYDRQAFSLNGQSQLSDEYSLSLVSRYETGGAKYDNKYGGDDENEHTNYSVKVGGHYSADALKLDASLATSQDQGGNFNGSTDNSAKNKLTTTRDQFGLLGQYTLSDKTSFVAGFDWYKEKVSANYDLNGWTPEVDKHDPDSRKASALFVQARHQVSSFLFEGAVRQDDIQGLDKETTYNVSAGYQLNADWLVSLSRGTGFKAPTFNDLYWPGSGNKNLKPENVTSNEVLVRNQFEEGSLEISVYDSKIKNLIAWADDGSGNWKPENIDSATAKGIDVTFSTELFGFSHLLTGGYVKTKDETTGEQLLRRPKLTANYTAGYEYEGLTANLMLDYRGESIDNKYAPVTLSSVLLTNISLSYQLLNELSVTGKVNNLFDKNYTVAEHYLTDGINYQVSATYTF